jgi:hypothetical protein
LYERTRPIHASKALSKEAGRPAGFNLNEVADKVVLLPASRILLRSGPHHFDTSERSTLNFRAASGLVAPSSTCLITASFRVKGRLTLAVALESDSRFLPDGATDESGGGETEGGGDGDSSTEAEGDAEADGSTASTDVMSTSFTVPAAYQPSTSRCCSACSSFSSTRCRAAWTMVAALTLRWYCSESVPAGGGPESKKDELDEEDGEEKEDEEEEEKEAKGDVKMRKSTAGGGGAGREGGGGDAAAIGAADVLGEDEAEVDGKTEDDGAGRPRLLRVLCLCEEDIVSGYIGVVRRQTVLVLT